MTINDTLLKIRQLQAGIYNLSRDIISDQEKAALNLQFQALAQTLHGGESPASTNLIATIVNSYQIIHARSIAKKNALLEQCNLRIKDLCKDFESIEVLRAKAEKVAEKTLVFSKCKQILFDGSASASDHDDPENELQEKRSQRLEM